MGEVYDATYAAVRSAIGSPNISGIFENALSNSFDISYAKSRIEQEFNGAIAAVSNELQRPSVLFRPELRPTPDGRRWAAFHQGHAFGFGNSPDEAMRSFDIQWGATVA